MTKSFSARDSFGNSDTTKQPKRLCIPAFTVKSCMFSWKVFPFLSPSKILSFRFLLKAYLAIHVILWRTRLAFYSHRNAPFSKGRAVTDSTVSGPQSDLSPSHLSSSAKGFGRVAAKYNSKSERDRELLWCMERNQDSALRHRLIKDSVRTAQGGTGRVRLRRAATQSWLFNVLQTRTVFKKPNKSVF